MPTTASASATRLIDCGGPILSSAVSIRRAVADDRSSTATPLGLCTTDRPVLSPGTSSRANVSPENPSASTTKPVASSTNQRVARGTVASIAG